jgi:hypothetical protein
MLEQVLAVTFFHLDDVLSTWQRIYEKNFVKFFFPPDNFRYCASDLSYASVLPFPAGKFGKQLLKISFLNIIRHRTVFTPECLVMPHRV